MKNFSSLTELKYCGYSQNYQTRPVARNSLIFYVSLQMLMEHNLLNSTAQLIRTTLRIHFQIYVQLNTETPKSKHSLKTLKQILIFCRRAPRNYHASKDFSLGSTTFYFSELLPIIIILLLLSQVIFNIFIFTLYLILIVSSPLVIMLLLPLLALFLLLL